MQNKRAVFWLTMIITGLCIFYLSFTYKYLNVEKSLERDVETQLEEQMLQNPEKYENPEVKESLRKSIRRSVRDNADTTLTYLGFKYHRVREFALNLGLDLQGGIHATLVVSPDKFIKNMAGTKANDPALSLALKEARLKQTSDNRPFTEIFYEIYTENNPPISEQDKGNQLWVYFNNPDNSFKITTETTDEEILDKIDKELEDGIKRNVEIYRNRLDPFGTTQPIITPLFGTGRIEIQIPGADDEEQVRTMLTSVAQLQFLEVYEFPEYEKYVLQINDYLKKFEANRIPKIDPQNTETEEPQNEDTRVIEVSQDDSADDLLIVEDIPEEVKDTNVVDTTTALIIPDDTASSDTGANAEEIAETPTNIIDPIFNYIDKEAFEGGALIALNKDAVNDLFSRPAVKKILPAEMKMLWDRGMKAGGEIDPETAMVFYFCKKDPRDKTSWLGGDAIIDAAADKDDRMRNAIKMDMNAEGARRWAKMTRENIKQRIAVVLDTLVYSAPYVQNEIANGSSQITGNYTVREAETLANILKAGKLPVPTEIERLAFVGPTLGKESVSRGLISLICGLALVIVFMVGYYNKGGLVANIALLFNVFFILGILSVPKLGATLTLPGIAGIVLTIGMAIDANVLIFERIREELRLGKTVQNAIQIGYKKAFWTIVDSNVTTLITAIILASLGSGLVKGFAVTLIIGICCSFFSSVYITRLIVDAMTRNKEKPRIAFTTFISKKLFQNNKLGFIKNRKIAYLFSLAIIASGIGIMASQGMNLGVEFRGGRAYTVRFNQTIQASDVKAKLKDDLENAGTIVKTFDGDNQVLITTSYMADNVMGGEVVAEDSVSTIVRAKIIDGLNKDFPGYEPKIVKSNVIGPTIADDIKNTSIRSMIIALIAIFLYILIRFNRWQFSMGAIIALFHDVMIVLSVFAIAGAMGISYELDEVFVAAVLTIIGYSINDTVVVFDRVREFLKLNPRIGLGETLNSSINSTLSRTLMTSITTLLVIVVLFIFGGEALRGFSFALLVGVLIGTYSSIFIATPVVLDTTGGKKKKGDAPQAKSSKEVAPAPAPAS